MLFKRSMLEAIARGEVTLAFRRWKRATVSPGSRLRTALGELKVGAVEPVENIAIGAAGQDEADPSTARRAQ